MKIKRFLWDLNDFFFALFAGCYFVAVVCLLFEFFWSLVIMQIRAQPKREYILQRLWKMTTKDEYTKDEGSNNRQVNKRQKLDE